MTNEKSDKLWADYCQKPEDRELLRVYADALGGPRGDFINLCLIDAPTVEQEAAKAALMKKDKKKLAGPAGPFLREFDFGPNGLVSFARTEAAQVIAGGDAWKTVNPRLVLTITSIKTLKDAIAFASADLGAIWFVDFGWITGTHGGMNLSDKQLAAIAPALAPVQHLQFSVRGGPDKCFSPAGLRAVAPSLQSLRYLAIDFYSVGLAPAADYIAAVRETLPKLRAFDFSAEPGTGLLEGGTRADQAKQQDREFADQLAAALA